MSTKACFSSNKAGETGSTTALQAKCNPSGLQLLRDYGINKGLAFSVNERRELGILGLLPPAVQTQDTQVTVALEYLKRCETDLDRYVYLMALLDRNERLFYRVVNDNVELTMPLIYTPVVGLACQKYGLVLGNPKGLYIPITEMGNVSEIIGNWPEETVKVIVVTDGERILGLGDLGVNGMGIPVGKLCLYTACAGVTPRHCLPITLDVGTNNESYLNDPLYIGLRQKRTVGKQYEDFLDEFMQAVVKRYGQYTLIQFEDFGNHNAFHLLEKYRNNYCTFNDDIQGTASVTVAGILASCRLTNRKLSENTFLFQGAGEAALGIANLLVAAMEGKGVAKEEAIKRVWLVDSKGLIVKDRPKGGLTPLKSVFAHEHAPIDTLEQAVKEVKPTAIIGVAAVPGAFSTEVLRTMADLNKTPIVFALSNPTSKAECTAEQAYTTTEGRCVFASGSPFDPVSLNGRTFYPSQGNNAYIFPGVGLAAALCQAKHITDGVFLAAAKSLSGMVDDADIKKGLVYPPLTKIREVSIQLATDLTKYLYDEKLATHTPEPEDKLAFIRSQLYSADY